MSLNIAALPADLRHILVVEIAATASASFVPLLFSNRSCLATPLPSLTGKVKHYDLGSIPQLLMETLDLITVNPDICLGQPTIRGMRITVSFVLKLLASHLSVQEILAAYPELEIEDIQQALSYATLPSSP